MSKRFRYQIRQGLRVLDPLKLYSPRGIAAEMFPCSSHKKYLARETLDRMSADFADPRGIFDIDTDGRWWGFQWQAATNTKTDAIPWTTSPISKTRLLCRYPDLARKLAHVPDFLIPPHLAPAFFLGIQVWLLVEPIKPRREHLNRKRLAGGMLIGMPSALLRESFHPGWFR